MVSGRYHFPFASDRSCFLRYINSSAIRTFSLSPILIVHFPFLFRDNKPSTFCLSFKPNDKTINRESCEHVLLLAFLLKYNSMFLYFIGNKHRL